MRVSINYASQMVGSLHLVDVTDEHVLTSSVSKTTVGMPRSFMTDEPTLLK